MSCHICDNLEYLHAYNIEDLIDVLMDVMSNGENGVSIVADQDNTKELMYYAINGEYNIGSIELNSYEYDGPYITTIIWDDDNYEITIERAYISEDCGFIASGYKTYIQYDLVEKCEYIDDVINNEYKYVDGDLAIFGFGENCDSEDESDDDEHGLYTYANEYKIDGVFGQIFVSSNLKDFVEMVKDDFENVFS